MYSVYGSRENDSETEFKLLNLDDPELKEFVRKFVHYRENVGARSFEMNRKEYLELWKDEHLRGKKKTLKEKFAPVMGGLGGTDIVNLTKKIGVPVYMISRRDNDHVFYIEEKIPHLGELGLAKIYPAEQLYQDIFYFLNNTIKDSPDTAPPVAVSNKDRIEQHGFDIKKSFRHRKD